MDRKSQNLGFRKRGSVSRLRGGDSVKNDGSYFTSKNRSSQSLNNAKPVVPATADVDEPMEDELHTAESSSASLGSESREYTSNFSVSMRDKSSPQTTMETESKLRAELSKYKKELKDYNETTKDLEEKYVRINLELAEMQQKHDRFVTSRKKRINEPEYTDNSDTSGSEYALKRKSTQVFHGGNTFLKLLPPDQNEPNYNDQANVDVHVRRKKKQPSNTEFVIKQTTHSTSTQKRLSKHRSDNKENDAQTESAHYNQGPHQSRSHDASLKDIYNVLKTVLDTNQKNQSPSQSNIDVTDLHNTINSLQKEQAQFRTIIQQQQNCLHDYHARCLKAQHIMQTQQVEIEKLNSNNHQLESEITGGIDKLRAKIDTKLRDVSHLPLRMREEQSKSEKLQNENIIITERLRTLQKEMTQMKAKLEEAVRRKTMAVTRLKAAERDLKIFRNYNASLKSEKHKIAEELQSIKDHMETLQANCKRTITRQREQTEKQRRELQKRVFDLELKLSRSQSSTATLIHERDSLIAELQSQLNTLVHNFEVSQKHIRVLRHHIYSMSGNNAPGTVQA